MPIAAGSDIELSVGPFGGVFDPSDPGGARPTRLFQALNMMIADPKNGSAIMARHGFQGQVTQLGASNIARQGQGSFAARQLDGTLRRICFGGGRMYEWNGLSGALAVFTDITPANVKIHESNPVFVSELNGELLVTDENNKPWKYTMETATAVTIAFNDLDEEWCTKGPMVIYGGYPVCIVKQVGQATLQAENLDILQTESGLDLTSEPTQGFRNTIAWGNPFDATTGWDQAAYDHTWQLTQTSGELLGCLFAEEGHLLYLRTEGMGKIFGPISDGVGANWRTNATRDGTSATVGTDAPAAFVAVDDLYFFVDIEGRPHKMQRDGVPQPLWLPIRREVEANFGTQQNRTSVVTYARAAYHKEYDLVLFTIWDRTTVYAYNARTGNYLGEWQLANGVHITAMGSLPDSYNRNTFLVFGSRSNVFTESAMGVVWKQKHPDDAQQWLDQADATQAVYTSFTRAIETHWLEHKAARSYKLRRAIAELLGDVAQHAVRFLYKTSAKAQSTALVAQSSVTVGGEDSRDAISTAKWSFGRNAQGPSVRVRLEATHSDNVRFGVHSLTIDAQVTEVRPRAT